MDIEKLLESLEKSDIERDTILNSNTRGHIWDLNERGHIRVHIGDFHNTITCATCHYTYCTACHDAPQKDCKGVRS